MVVVANHFAAFAAWLGKLAFTRISRTYVARRAVGEANRGNVVRSELGFVMSISVFLFTTMLDAGAVTYTPSNLSSPQSFNTLAEAESAMRSASSYGPLLKFNSLLQANNNVIVLLYAIQSIKPNPESWSDWCNVSGEYSSGQAVCDARKSIINWPYPLTYSGGGNGYEGGYGGRCTDTHQNVMGYPQVWVSCPTGYNLANATYGNQCGGNHVPEGYGGTPICVNNYTATITIKPDVLSCCRNQPFAGDPINVSNGNLFEVEADYVGNGVFPLSFRRYYNSRDLDAVTSTADDGYIYLRPGGFQATSRIGAKFHHTYDRTVTVDPTAGNSPGNFTTVRRPDGSALHFQLLSGQLVPADASIKDSLRATTNGWQYITEDDEVEDYDATGRLVMITNRAGFSQRLSYDSHNRLQGVTDPSNRSLTVTYDDTNDYSNRVHRIIDPAGGVYTYHYNGDNLASVTYPDGKTHFYSYNEPAYTSGAALSSALTGIVDENGARYTTWNYDGQGRAISSEHASGVDKTTVAYTGSNGSTVTDAVGTPRTYQYINIYSVARGTGITQPCTTGCTSTTASTAYDAQGNVSSRTDFNGITTTYTYDLTRNLETSRTEAYGTAQQRTISTQWHSTFRLPTVIAEPLKITTYTYDATSGNVLTKSERATTDTNGSAGFGAALQGSPRVWTYTYTTSADGTLPNLLKTIDGPRTNVSDITTYAYDAQGNLASITNALGQVTQITSYDAHGHPLTIKDPNNLISTLAYDPRGRLLSRTTGGLTTGFTYDGVGQLIQITYPDASTTVYTYDAAHRLTQITDSLGNSIVYTLDALGHVVREEVSDNGGVSHIPIPSSLGGGLAGTTTLLTASPTLVPVGQPLSLSAYVVSNGASAPSGTMTFNEGGTTVGTATLSANGSNSALATLTLSIISTGTHSYTVSYSGDANNGASTSTPTSVQTRAASSVSFGGSTGPNPATAGQTVTLKALVTGSAPTGTVSFNDGTTTLATVALSNNAGVYSASYSTAALAAGTHSLTARYSGDANNSASTSASLSEVITPPLPDLSTTALSFTGSTVNAGGTLSVTTTVKNQGTANAGSSSSSVHLSTNANYGDADDIILPTPISIGALASGVSGTVSASVTIPSTTPGGTYYVCAMTDASNAMAEGDETNNTLSSFTPIIVPLPDLIMTALSTTATAVSRGATFSVSRAVKNQGGSTAGPSVVDFHLSTNATYGDADDIVLTGIRTIPTLAGSPSGAYYVIVLTGARSIPPLAVNTSSSTDLTGVTVPVGTPVGTYYICAQADSTNAVNETNETNNAACTTTINVQ